MAVPTRPAWPLALALRIEDVGDATLNPERDVHDPWVVRGGLASPENLISGTTPVAGYEPLTGFSVQSFPGKSIVELAASGQFRNKMISVARTSEPLAIGVPVVLTPMPPNPNRPQGNPFHATASVPLDMGLVRATQISAVFRQLVNPAPVPGR